MKKVLTLVIGVSLALGALAGTASAAPKQKAGSQNIVEIAQSLKRFLTLVDLVVAADLVDVLTGEGTFTVFAPTNKVFNKLEAAVPGVTAALLDPANKVVLQRVLKYYLLGIEVRSPAAQAAARARARVQTLLGKGPNARIQLRGKNRINIRDSAGINTARVFKPFDVQASNGVIYTINKVLIPRHVCKTLKAVGLL